MTYYEEPHHKIHKVTLNLILKIFYYIFILLQVSNHKAKNIRNSFVHPHQVTSPPTIKYKKKTIKKQTEKEKMLWKSYFKIQTYGARKKQCLNIFNRLRVADDVGFL